MRTLRWPWIILACAAVASSTIIFIYQMVLLYVASYPLFGPGEPGGGQSARVADLVGGWGARGFFFGLTIFASYWVARRIGVAPTLHGVLVGVLAAIAVQAIFHFAMPPVYLGEALIYFTLGTTGGYVGSVIARNALAGQEALYRASRQISGAGDPQTVAAAIGEHLGGPEVSGVALWRAIREPGEATPKSESATAFEFWTAWDPRTQEIWPSATQLDVNMLSSMTHLRGRRSATLRTEDLAAPERTEWERRGVRAALLMTLTVPGDITFGILMVAFRNKRRFSKGAIREYLTVGEQAALRLENLRLVGEARTFGRRIGVLEERQRLSREIHDSMKGNFTGIDLLASALLNDTSPGGRREVDARRHHLELIRQAARDGARDSERMVQALRPEAVERRPLHTALGEFTERWAEEAGVEAAVTATGQPRELPPQVEDALWRVAQEAFLNIS